VTFDYVILGGGVAGLTAARELLKRGKSVALIEKGSEVGGLARTIEKEGFRFDIGGHRFHSHNQSVVKWLKDLLGDDLLTVPRFSRIHLEGKFADYPIRFPGALSIFSPPRAAWMLASFLAAKITERNRDDISFKDWVVKRYGRKLHSVFFEPYTEKVWGIPCNELSATWASQRIGIPSMWRAIKHAVKPPKEILATTISEFYYPRSGFGMIPKALGDDILRMGGLIHTSFSLTRVLPMPDGGFEIEASTKDGSSLTLQAKQIVSTLPLNLLLEAIPQEFGSKQLLEKYQLEYRDIICVFMTLDQRQVSGDSWTYFPSKELVFGRTHEPKNWSVEMVPDQTQTSLAVEIFATRGEPTWMMSDEEIIRQVASQMHAIGWIDESNVRKSWVLRVPNAYPVYRIGYEEKLQQVKSYLGQWPNLHLAGRTGSFRYMNSDGVVEDAFDLMGRLFPHSQEEVEALAVQEGRWM